MKFELVGLLSTSSCPDFNSKIGLGQSGPLGRPFKKRENLNELPLVSIKKC